jgi:hypothetical protein
MACADRAQRMLATLQHRGPMTPASTSMDRLRWRQRG